MVLPFKGDRRRVWQCFVCGEDYETFNDFKDHIIKEHEEGKDYVLCPLKRCGAPIRDLRLHFKAKHPREKIPPGCQLKAIVWKDKKKNKKKPQYKQGSIISEKNDGKEITYRSGYEYDVYGCLELLPEVVAYDTEKVEIPYFYDGKEHIYLPDLRIVFNDEDIELWEIKPDRQKHLPKNQAKWLAAREYCQIRGWRFVVITEVGIKKLKRKAKNLDTGSKII
jgi:hypothetical protein